MRHYVGLFPLLSVDRGRLHQSAAARLGATTTAITGSQPPKSSGLAHRPLQGRGGLAQAAARPRHSHVGLELGIFRWRVCGVIRSHLDCDARRASPPERFRHRGPVRGADASSPVDGQRRRHLSDVRAGRQAWVGAPLSALDSDPGRSGKPDRRVGPPGRAVQQAALWPRAAPDQDQSLRSGEARLDHRRPAAHDLPLHLRRKLVHSKGELGVRGRGPTRSTGPPTSPGCPTAPISSPTAMAAPASPSTTPRTTSSRTGARRRPIRRTPGPTSSTPSTASPSAPTGGCSWWTAATRACRCSTWKESSSTCGRCDRRTGPPARTP